MRYPKLYGKYLAMSIKSRLAYKTDIFIGALSFIISNGVGFLTLAMTIGVVGSIDVWKFENLIFLYAYTLIPKSIDHMFTDNIWGVGTHYVVRGEIDKYLTKPVNPLFQLISENFCADGIGEFILGVSFFCIYFSAQSIIWTPAVAIMLIVCAFFSIFVFTSIKLFTGSLAFWIKRSIAIMSGIYNMCELAKYPIHLFGDVAKAIMFYVIPYGLTMFLPIQQALTGENALNLPWWGLSLIVACVSATLLFLSYKFWQTGLKRYESAGS